MKLPLLKGLFGAKKQQPVMEALQFKTEPLVAAFQDDVLDKHTVEQAAVSIADREGRGLYFVSEPELTPEEQRTYSLLRSTLLQHEVLQSRLRTRQVC